MDEKLPERVARLEEHISTQNGLLKEIRDEQHEMRDDIQALGRSLYFFKGAWSAVTVVFAALVAWASAHFGGKY